MLIFVIIAREYEIELMGVVPSIDMIEKATPNDIIKRPTTNNIILLASMIPALAFLEIKFENSVYIIYYKIFKSNKN